MFRSTLFRRLRLRPRRFRVRSLLRRLHSARVSADDGGEANLKYTWTATGPAAVDYSANGTNAAKNTMTMFTQAGDYNFTVTITDAAGFTATSSVSVTVDQTLSTIDVTPLSVNLFNGQSQQFSATAIDQFGNAMAVQPTISWTTDAGSVGSVDASGVYTAPSSAIGTATVRAAAGAISGTATANVTWLKGDLNGDGKLSAADLSTMMMALADLSSYQNGRGISSADMVAIADVDGDGQITSLDLQALISAVASAQVGAGSGSAAVVVTATNLADGGGVGGETESPTLVTPASLTKIHVNLSTTCLLANSDPERRLVIRAEVGYGRRDCGRDATCGRQPTLSVAGAAQLAARHPSH